MTLSPVVVFAYKRPGHLRKVLDSLAKNKESSETMLYILCDGPKQNANQDELYKIAEVIAIARAENRFLETIVIAQEKNKGLACSIIDGVTMVLQEHETVIVLEDDLILSPYFLYYMNDSLSRYKNNMTVGQIGGCNCFACGDRYPSTFFLAVPDCLGWATWQNRWSAFINDPNYLLQEIKRRQLEYTFNAYGSYDMEAMLQEQANGKGTSWAVKWTAVSVLNNWLTLYPNPSVTNHIESEEATNANINIMPPLVREKPLLMDIAVIELPETIEALKKKYSGIGDYFGNTVVSQPTSNNSIGSKLKRIASRVLTSVFQK